MEGVELCQKIRENEFGQYTYIIIVTSKGGTDVFDALINKRIYKNAYSREMTRVIITKDMKNHFDPLVLDAFVQCEDRLFIIARQFQG